MKKITIVVFALLSLCLVLAFLLRPDLSNDKAVIVDVEYDPHRDKNLEINDEESIEDNSSELLPATNNADWREKVASFGFTVEQVTHQEILNAQTQANNPSPYKLITEATDAFIFDLTSGFDPNSGERNQLTPEDIRATLTNIDRQIASMKQLRSHILSLAEDNIPGRQNFEKEYDSSISRLMHLRQSMLNSSYLLNNPEYQP